MSMAARFLVLISSLLALRLSPMALYSPAAFPGPTYENVPEYGQVVKIGEGVLDVSIESSVIRNVWVALPLTMEDIELGDTVLLKAVYNEVYATAVLEHRAYRGDRVKGTYRPPAPTNVRVEQSDNGPVLKWEWGGTAQERLQFAHYDVDARLVGGAWGYDLYPIETTETSHLSRNQAVTLQVRVRAVSMAGVSSAWVVSSDVLIDIMPPATPTNFTVDHGTNQLHFTWTPPPDPDVVRYEIHKWAGNVWSPVLKIANVAGSVSEATIDLPYDLSDGSGIQYYRYTIKAIDAAGNESEFYTLFESEVGPYGPIAVVFPTNAGQILTNADWERGSGDALDGWGFTYLNNDGYTVGAYGMGGSKGILYTFPGNINQYGYYSWPGDVTAVKVPPMAGWYTSSFYIKPIDGTIDDWVPDFVSGQYYGARLVTTATNGVTEYVRPDTINPGGGLQALHYEAVGDGWYRVWSHSFGGFSETYPYLFVAFSAASRYNPNLSAGDQAQFDRPMVEFGGPYPGGFSLVPTTAGASSGLSLDTTGLSVDGDQLVTIDGEIGAHLEPSVTDSFNIGNSNSWADIKYAGDLKPKRGSTVFTGKVLVSSGYKINGTQDDLADNDNHVIESQSGIVVPAGGHIEAEGVFDIQPTSWSSGTNITLRLNITGGGSGITTSAIFPSFNSSIGRQGYGGLMIYASCAAETTLGLQLEAQLWDYTKMTMRIYTTWTRFKWRVYA